MVSIVVLVHFIIIFYCFEITSSSILISGLLLIFQYIRTTREDITKSKNLIPNTIMIIDYCGHVTPN